MPWIEQGAWDKRPYLCDPRELRVQLQGVGSTAAVKLKDPVACAGGAGEIV